MYVLIIRGTVYTIAIQKQLNQNGTYEFDSHKNIS